MMYSLPLSLLLGIILSCNGAVDIEKHLKVCARNSPNVNSCLMDAVQYGISALAGGSKDLGVPPIDPYIQKKLRLDFKTNQLQVNMNNKNIRVVGLTASTVRAARLDADEHTFHLEVDMYSPAISVSGRFEGSASFSVLNVSATGTYEINMTDLVYTWKLDGKPEIINDEVYVRINSFYMRPDVSSMNVHVTNDAPDAKRITELSERVINDNWRTLYRQFLPFTIQNWNRMGTKVANKIFLKVPYNELFPNKL